MTILVNRIKCNKCGDVIESKTTHDFKWCKCGTVAIDGGLEYLKRCAPSQESFQECSIIRS